MMAIVKRIGEVLNADAAITSYVESRIYFLQAPDIEATRLPLVVVDMNSENSPNETPVDAINALYLVKAESKDALIAGEISEAIRDVLHEAEPGVAGDWKIFRCQHESTVFYPENDARQTIYHAGGLYRIQAHR